MQSETKAQPALLAILPVDRQGPWLQACLMAGGGIDLRVSQVGDLKEAAAASRRKHFDAALVWHEGSGTWTRSMLEQAGRLKLFEGGSIVLGMKTHEGWHVPLIEAGAAVCLDLDQCDPITLVHQIRNTTELIRLRNERSRMKDEAVRAGRREVEQLDRLMTAQQTLLSRLDALHEEFHPAADDFSARNYGTGAGASDDRGRGPMRPSRSANEAPATLQLEYIACLKQYTFDASAAASHGIRTLAVKCHSLGLGSRALMRLHLAALEVTTHGAGTGSLRHILSQADRFLIELLLEHLEQAAAGGASGSNLPAGDRSGLVNSPSVAA